MDLLAPAKNGKHLRGETLHLTELVQVAEPADEMVDPRVMEFFEPFRDGLWIPYRTPVGEIHGLAQLWVVAGNVLAESAGGLMLRVADIHRHLIGDGVAREVRTEIIGRLPELRDLL